MNLKILTARIHAAKCYMTKVILSKLSLLLRPIVSFEGSLEYFIEAIAPLPTLLSPTSHPHRQSLKRINRQKVP